VDASLFQAAATLPRLLVIAGLVTALAFAIARRRSLGRASPLAITGIALLILESILGIAITLYVYSGFRMLRLGNYMTVMAVHNLVSAVLWAVGMGLVIAAVFIGRDGVSPAPAAHSPPGDPLP